MEPSELSTYRLNMRMHQAVSASFIVLFPWQIINLLSRRYNPAYYNQQLKLSGAGLFMSFSGMFFVGMRQSAFFERMRYKYFKQMSDEEIVNFDGQMRAFKQAEKQQQQQQQVQQQQVQEQPAQQMPSDSPYGSKKELTSFYED